MQDPIGNFERMRELYISYLDTAFRIGDENVADERRTLLRKPGTLCTEALVEPIPRYEGYRVQGRDFTFDDIYSNPELLPGFDEPSRRAFVELILAGLFPSRMRDPDSGSIPLSRVGRFAPYRHQLEMLSRGVRPCSPGVVTSGTGSGKTESFLLPLLATITREASSWPEPDASFLQNRWWHDSESKPFSKPDKRGRRVVRYGAIPQDRRPLESDPLRSPFVPHRTGEHRPAAMRAIVLYPMNALVEDQLVRLRKALDSREAREVMDTRLRRNRIFFGRYTGATPVTGHHLHPGFRSLLGTPKRGLAGDIYYPDHRDADPATGRVSLVDLRTSELEKRQRRLEELFDFQVALERGQIQARLHALDRVAEEELGAILRENGCIRGAVEGRDFIDFARRSGKRSDDGLQHDFRGWVGRDASAAEIESLQELVLSERDANHAPSSSSADDSPFIFPSVDGGEMSNRWDMQEHPPDILITNVSMLSAMLNREVEEPIFKKTKEWLQKPDSYFYLVLDELHLQRGAAGTEVAYLIRILLHRLGLTSSSEQRRKIRILASSASLSGAPEDEAKKSANYLWDMFGPLGLAPGTEKDAGAAAWLESIVPGRERPSKYDGDPPPKVQAVPFIDLLRAHAPGGVFDPQQPIAIPLFARSPEGDDRVANAWNGIADALNVGDGPMPIRIARCVQDAAARIAWACREDDEGGNLRSRAIPLSELAERLFIELPPDSNTHLLAARAILFVRGCGDGLGTYLAAHLDSPPSFRVHTFFRSIEGLYAPASREVGLPAGPNDRVAEIGVLAIDQTDRIIIDGPDGRSDHRVYELVYCECCGELCLGGMRATIAKKSKYIAELLPQEPHLEGLPDQAISQRFEDLSFSQYGLFWAGPWDRQALAVDSRDAGRWIQVYLERSSGGIIRADKVEPPTSANLLPGWYYERNDNADHHRRTSESPGTHVPYGCPKCATSYVGRSKEHRLSPLRNFRTGFAKTTQLLATELFDSQRVSNPGQPAKLVSFSDSRQDAAKAALSIERFHHQDIRRELLFATLRDQAESKDPGPARAVLDQARADLAATPASFRNQAEARVAQLEEEYKRQADSTVLLQDAIENRLELHGINLPLKAFIARMVRLGVHPFDDAGQERALGSQGGVPVRFPWNRMFAQDDRAGTLRWADDEANQVGIESAREHVVSKVQELLTEVVFSKTYFSFEEAGLGYAAVGVSQIGGLRSTPDRAGELAAFMRVITDSYRYWPTPYKKPDERHAPWSTPGEVTVARVLRFAEVAWPHDPRAAIAEALEDLARCGHRDGVISIEQLRFQLVGPDDQFVRCGGCGRVHLHKGLDICTRCFKPLDWDVAAKEQVKNLHTRNFLARRVYRALEEGSKPQERSFRLHCEELTGQTEDPARRQREFKGIFLPNLSSVDPQRDDEDQSSGLILSAPDPLLKRKDEIDLLTVTTTMEVGIDIGPLQVVMQANMPPQRFNYQQRVGRAGRRGQAFSMALTICRTKSHDLFYFRHPKKMTGDPPPTPFLTKRMENIAQRFVRKGWLWQTFRTLREEVRGQGRIFPADLMSPPDIHGEYLPTSFLPSADGVDWRGMMVAKISEELPYAETLAALLSEGGEEIDLIANADEIVRSIDMALEGARQDGLAHSLSEAGLLPMYGMPTRVRQMYLRLKFDGDGAAWSTVDRDVDLAIYEFAPGSSIVIDKREHLAVGFTPDLAEPMPGRRDQRIRPYQDDAFAAPISLLECSVCRAWTEQHRDGGVLEECAGCGSKLHPDQAKECRVPHAFRTDLPWYPRPREDDVDSGVRHRSIQAEGKNLDFKVAAGFGQDGDWAIKIAHESGRTFRLNRGPQQEDGVRAFETRPGREIKVNRGQNLDLPTQHISTAPGLAARVAKTFQPDGPPQRFWLAAPKVTDALYITPCRPPAGLALHRLPGRLDSIPADATEMHEVTRWLGVRAAAMSASYLIVNRAALELDIDPQEFDVLEPRLHGKTDPSPLLHITDNLVNGAGFCQYLASIEEGAFPRLAGYIASMLTNVDEYPLAEFLDDAHSCDTSCYRCLRRYGNQPFHALLDWQLGLAFLRAAVDPRYKCGLDGAFDGPELRRWPDHAKRLADEMGERFEGGGARTFHGVPAFRIRLRKSELSPWILVGHPLWEWRDDLASGGILAKARDEAMEFGEPLCWDSFNLGRRQVFVRERIREELRRRV